MRSICSVCGIENRYDEHQRMYRRCDLCHTKHALKKHYNNKDKITEKKNEKHYPKTKEIFFE